tara:strand:- start:1343 stop:1960 length:618 start_codon:yes stop_codon:yes gene_type:complete
MTSLSDFIYIKKNALTKSLCDDIINLYEKEPGRYKGVTAGGYRKEIKETTDFVIPFNCDNWNKINQCLIEELNRNIKKYCNKFNQIFAHSNEENSDQKFKIFDSDHLKYYEFMVQKYQCNEGRYINHNDFSVEWSKNEYRVITYIFYLNDVNHGGETQFWNDEKVIPEKGQLVLFPASWVYPHRGLMPKSSDKYIITGWIYNKDQ